VLKVFIDLAPAIRTYFRTYFQEPSGCCLGDKTIKSGAGNWKSNSHCRGEAKLEIKPSKVMAGNWKSNSHCRGEAFSRFPASNAWACLGYILGTGPRANPPHVLSNTRGAPGHILGATQAPLRAPCAFYPTRGGVWGRFWEPHGPRANPPHVLSNMWGGVFN
jgi:hypothetical protein